MCKLGQSLLNSQKRLKDVCLWAISNQSVQVLNLTDIAVHVLLVNQDWTTRYILIAHKAVKGGALASPIDSQERENFTPFNTKRCAFNSIEADFSRVCVLFSWSIFFADNGRSWLDIVVLLVFRWLGVVSFDQIVDNYYIFCLIKVPIDHVFNSLGLLSDFRRSLKVVSFRLNWLSLRSFASSVAAFENQECEKTVDYNLEK